LNKNSNVLRNIGIFIIIPLFILGLYYSTFYDYLFFHTFVEFFSVLIGFGVFVIAWNSRHVSEDDFLLYIGLSFLFVSTIDILHTVSYKGMNILIGFDSNLPTQLWIAARYLQSISFLLSSFFLKRRIKPGLLLGSLSLITILLIASIFLGIFPDCYIENSGLTNFKIVSEYFISTISLLSSVLFFMNRKYLEKQVFQLIMFSIILMIGAELAFTFYVDVYGLSNFIGHIFKLFSFYFVYKAIVETGIKKPSALLHKKLNQSVKDLRLLSNKLTISHELERKQLSLELHDNIGQMLCILKLSNRPSILINKNKQEQKAILTQTSELIGEIIDATKDLSLKLRPPTLDDLGLVSALGWYAELIQTQSESKIHVNSTIKGGQRYDPALEITLYRVAEEALKNALKYSKAGSVQIELFENDGKIIVEIVDNGDGVSPDKLKLKQDRFFDIFAIRERVELIGGQLIIESKLTHGTTIRAILPLV
jgi:signal transduction histidine kinase